MKETKVTCPICGAEFAIAEHTHVANGVVIGKDAGLGEIHPALAGDSTFMGATTPVATPAQAPATTIRNKADERLAALKAAGVDVSDLFAMQGAAGDGMIARMSNGILSVVADDDPIFQAIAKGGTIPDRRLFRRWVMSQMFHMLTEREHWNSGRRIGFTEAIHRKGYEYQFKMLQDELNAQAKLFQHDIENFQERNVWFNKRVLTALCESYVLKLMEYVEKLPERKCKGVPYKRIDGRNIFCADIPSKVYAPVRSYLAAIKRTSNPVSLATLFAEFNKTRIQLPWDTPQCAEWVKAYKGAGAFFTLKNLILFHGCYIFNTKTCHLSKEASIEFINTAAHEYALEGWRMFALMKKALKDNNINIEAKMAEWKKR